jgi:hypothetical protein
MIVRRPTKRQSFNGTVVMEWLNTAVGHDIDGFWLISHSHLMRRGYAWIGVSAFRASVHTPVTGLEAWSPARYGALDVPAVGADVNALSFDIFSQAGQAVKAPAGIDPMGGLNVERIFAAGASLSANSGILPYDNGIHRLAGVFAGTRAADITIAATTTLLLVTMAAPPSSSIHPRGSRRNGLDVVLSLTFLSVQRTKRQGELCSQRCRAASPHDSGDRDGSGGASPAAQPAGSPTGRRGGGSEARAAPRTPEASNARRCARVGARGWRRRRASSAPASPARAPA